ncbi:MAG: PDZ domain-containing protein, partial [Candidatus Aminicenantes bacterium]
RETPTPSGKDLGLTVRELNPYLARRYGLQTKEGLLITEVTRYSQAERKGLRAGDIIIEVNRIKIKSLEDLEGILDKLDSGDPIILLIRRERDGRAQEFVVTLRIP